jgi:SAM-dependent methyltransferase
MDAPDRDADARRLSARALADDEPTGWFEPLYAQARAGSAIVPWDRGAPNAMLVAWVEAGRLPSTARTALVVGCGPGRDSEFLAGQGLRTTAFDISPTAVTLARERHPESSVDYTVADLLALPADWQGNFDLVLESHNVQALPASVRGRAIAAVAPLVAPGGTLLVLAAARDDGPEPDGPPWPLTRAEVDALGAGLETVQVERVPDAADATITRWRAQFRRG